MTYALITGAGRGIGKALAEELARRKHNVLLVSRTEPELVVLASDLEARYKITAHYLALDLTEQGAIAKLLEWTNTNNFEIDILINNAGWAKWGLFSYVPLVEHLNSMRLNMDATVELCHLFLPMLMRQPKAYILNVSSMAAYQAMPSMAIYAASKAFVVSFSRALRQELKATSISVSCLCPGGVKTSFMDRAAMKSLEASVEKFMMQPSKVAQIALDGMFNRKMEIIPGFSNRISAGFTLLLPNTWLEAIVAKIYKVNQLPR